LTDVADVRVTDDDDDDDDDAYASLKIISFVKKEKRRGSTSVLKIETRKEQTTKSDEQTVGGKEMAQENS